MRVALVHDWLNQLGGAEAVLETFADRLFPGAPVFTSIYWRKGMPAHYQQWDIRTSWLDRVPGVYRHHQLFLPLYPLAFESFDFTGYDLVLSNKSGFCHGVITPPETVHICYCLTPTRYLWRYRDYASREGLGRGADLFLAPLLMLLRMWDRLAADRVDHFIAISEEVRRRIATYYRRESEVIHPPVDVSRFTPTAEQGDYFLVVSRLIPYKRVDLAVRACTQLGLPLKVVGDGRDRPALERIAGPTVEFLGRVDDEALPDLVARCRAFLFPGEEDFGIAPVEAMAAGRPVIAYGRGGALDTVVEGVTGLFFHEPTVEALAEVLARFDSRQFDPQVIREHALQFSREVFLERMRSFIARVV